MLRGFEELYLSCTETRDSTLEDCHTIQNCPSNFYHPFCVSFVIMIPIQLVFLMFDSVFSLPEIFTPPKLEGSPRMAKIRKIVLKVFLIAQKKRPDALNATQKTPAL